MPPDSHGGDGVSQPTISQATLDYVLGAEHAAALREMAVRTARVCGGIVAAIGIVVIVGWFVGSTAITTILPGSSSMKFNAALAFVAAGAALILLTISSPRATAIASLAAVFVALVGAASVVEALMHVDLGIGELIVRDVAPTRGRPPGRMAMHTGFAFMAAGTALLLLVRGRARLAVSHALASAVAAIAILALGGHLYSSRGTYETAFFAGMAVHTAVAFMFLSFGIFAARPHSGIGVLLFSPTLTSRVARRWLVGAVTIPLGLGFIAMELETHGVLDPASAAALLVGTIAFVIGAAVVAESANSNRFEGRRLEWERERTRLVSELEKALAEVHSLSGLLPICSHCKRIRDDDGDWERLERYITERSAAEFSHSLCPDCMKKHYGEYL